MNSTKTYIKASECISFIAYKDVDALSYVFSAEVYKKWDTFELHQLLCRLEMISRGEATPKDAWKEFADSLIATLNRPVNELATELKQDIASPLKYKYDEEQIRSAEKIFIEALRSESLKIYGVKHIGNGNSEEIPMTFLRRSDYRIDVQKNRFYFDLYNHGSLVLHNIVKRVKHIQEWENLQVHFADISQLWGHNTTNTKDITRKARKPNKDEVREVARSVYRQAPKGQKPNIVQAETLICAEIRDKFGKAAGKDESTGESIVRIILSEDEFENQRRRAGRQNKS